MTDKKEKNGKRINKCDYLVNRSLEILSKEGFSGLLKAVKRFLLFHPLRDEVVYRCYGKIKKEVIKDILDFKMYLDLRDWGICKDLFFDGIREPESTKIFIKELSTRKRVNVLDIGANIGYYVLIEAKNINNGKVYAIEPDPRNFKYLKRNIELNQCSNIVETYNMAMGDQEGTIEFVMDKCFNLSRIRRPMDDENISKGSIIKVPITTVDSFIESRNIDINFVRMDVEGYEYFIVKGMKKLLKEDLNLFIEIHPNFIRSYGGSVNDFFKMLNNYNVKYIVVDELRDELRNVVESSLLRLSLIHI